MTYGVKHKNTTNASTNRTTSKTRVSHDNNVTVIFLIIYNNSMLKT